MRRLTRIMLGMDYNTQTYAEMYDGPMSIKDPRCPNMPPIPDNSSIYYQGDIGFDITGTHKLAQDKPTVTWSIPAENLGLKAYTAAAADFCLREFGKYIDALNAELYNRSRPDNENGKYYLNTPGGEILERNTAYFALCPQRDYNYGGGLTVCLLPNDQLQPPRMCLCIRLKVQLPKKNFASPFKCSARTCPTRWTDLLPNLILRG